MTNDTISRQAVHDLIIEIDPYWAEGMTRAIYDGVSKLPPVEWQGRWNIELDKNRLFYECKCSVCGHIESFDPKYRWFNYCPNCGARMEGEAE